MTYDFAVSEQIGAPPEEIYEAWLSSEGHTAMTGGAANVSDEEGAEFDAWDGYIHGKNLVLEPPKRIVQLWRTANFTDEHEDSQIEVLFEGNEDGTLVTVRHTNVPADQRGYEEGGWQKSYFDPMKEYFEGP